MKVAVLRKPLSIEIQETNIPQLDDNEVLVKSKVGGICGTDIAIYEGYRDVRTPIIIGHEVCGEVVEIGKGVTNLNVGDHVVLEPNYVCGKCRFCRAGLYNLCTNKKAVGVNYDGVFSEYFKAPEKYLWKVPPNIDFYEAVLTEPLACVLHSLRNVNLLPEDNALVIGGGAIGAITALILQHMGINVAILDRSLLRIEMLRKRGFNAFHLSENSNAINEFFENEGVDLILDAVGSETNLQGTINFLRAGGNILIIGLSATESKLPLHQIVRKEVNIKGTLIYRGDFFNAIKIISKKKIPINKVVTHVFNFNEIGAAFETSKRKDRLKVLIAF
jgi:2-desacetyl-2-hydroxyethyl bacteriochlorophyllide A dehydrogenase